MYVDQFPRRDLARKLAARYKVPLFDTIAKALTLGSDRLAVDGVISVGEHGNYPWNKLQQHLYPRRRFFEQITDILARFKRVVPVFSDKHLGPVWSDAQWMYDRARELKVPFMAGSSLPLTFRCPDLPSRWAVRSRRPWALVTAGSTSTAVMPWSVTKAWSNGVGAESGA